MKFSNPIFSCDVCGISVVRRSARHKYCDSCAIDISNLQTKKHNEENRKYKIIPPPPTNLQIWLNQKGGRTMEDAIYDEENKNHFIVMGNKRFYAPDFKKYKWEKRGSAYTGHNVLIGLEAYFTK